MTVYEELFDLRDSLLDEVEMDDEQRREAHAVVDIMREQSLRIHEMVDPTGELTRFIIDNWHTAKQVVLLDIRANMKSLELLQSDDEGAINTINKLSVL